MQTGVTRMTLHNKRTSSRRDILCLGAAVGAMRLLSTPETAYGAEQNDETDKVFPGYKTVKPFLRTTARPQSV
jgi:hypothetical protein